MKRTAAAALLLLSWTDDRIARASAPDPITASTVRAVTSWVAGVRSHTPGRRDAAVGQTSTMTFEKRLELNPGVMLFLSALQGERVVADSDARKQIVDAARQTLQSPGADIFLKRAAILHGDAAMLNKLDDRAVNATGASSTPASSPLLTRHRLFLDKDGEIKGEVLADWNWPFARSLLDRLVPRPADDPFVAVWYHATTAFMFRWGLYGEAVTHLARSAAVLGDDALALFDRACYSEIQGLPVTQVLLSEDDIMALRALRAGRRLPPSQTPRGVAELGIPLPELANDEAERLFRRALRVAPDLVEARVRLARLLVERNRHQEAAGELSTVFAAKPEGPVAFYAHLFAGRAAQGLGRLDEAAGHYREATALFPGAQSARLASSQAALLGADVPATLEPIEHLDRSSPAPDPWWQYHFAAGRDVDDILRDMWSKVAKF